MAARPFEQNFMLPPGCKPLTFEHNRLAEATFSLRLLSRLCQHFRGLATLAPDLCDRYRASRQRARPSRRTFAIRWPILSNGRAICDDLGCGGDRP